MKKVISSLALIVLIIACKKTETISLNQEEIVSAPAQNQGGSSSPTVTTSTASFITSATATSGGNVSSGGGGNNVTERGVCYNTSPNPTISNNKVVSGSGAGSFTSVLSGLAGSTTYYIRAYAIKSTGTTYGNQVSFTTLTDYGTVTDFDGNVYHTITIGSQVWTVENLKTTHYRDGTAIPFVTDNTAWTALSTGAYCNYNNDESIAAVYGKLYNWYAVVDSRNIAPAGWHAPSYAEWNTLANYLGGSNAAGGRLKEAGSAHWTAPNIATNSSGFSALPGAGRLTDPATNTCFFLSPMSYEGNWWTTTPTSGSSSAWAALYIRMEYYDESIFHASWGNVDYNKNTGYSVRCVKD